MAKPSDISDMPESEVPWEFLVDAPERRHSSDRRKHGHDDPCLDLMRTENKLAQLIQEFYEHKHIMENHIEDCKAERSDILAELKRIGDILARQKGFVAGVMWVTGGLLGVAGIVFELVKDSIHH